MSLDISFGDPSNSKNDFGLVMNGSGQWDIPNQAMAVNVNLGITSGSSNLSSATPVSMNTQEVVAGGTDYAQMPSGQTVQGKSWISIPLGSAAADFGNSSQCSAANSPMTGTAISDPSGYLSFLKSVSSSVQDVGSDVVNGQVATHYHASIDTGQLASQQIALGCQQVNGAVLQSDGVTSVPVDIWIGPDGLITQEQLSFSSGPGDTQFPFKVTTTIGLSNYGEPTNIVPPPASQVISVSQAFNSSTSA